MGINTAWVFPGQGSQVVGMGVGLKEFPIAKAKLEQAEQILGWSVLEDWTRHENNLSATLYTQPYLYVILSILALSDDATGIPAYAGSWL